MLQPIQQQQQQQLQQHQPNALPVTTTKYFNLSLKKRSERKTKLHFNNSLLCLNLIVLNLINVFFESIQCKFKALVFIDKNTKINRTFEHSKEMLLSNFQIRPLQIMFFK